jgi:phosphatidylglycerol:prolipoprotein diacylglycerol transferase
LIEDDYTRPNMIVHFHPLLHPLFEALGYACGYALYRWERGRSGDVLDEEQRWAVLAAAAIGGLLGSRLLGLLEEVPQLTMKWQAIFLPGGKTIVGGLLGGWITVEIVKHLRGIISQTGDLLVFPLCIGIAVGRIGCFLAGLADDTYGIPTKLLWGIDFGDGIPRHPTQLYEIIFLGSLAFVFSRYGRSIHPEGSTFKLFLAAYLGWRLAVDFVKPQPLVYGMNLIQWSCIAGLVALTPSLFSILIARGQLVRSFE